MLWDQRLGLTIEPPEVHRASKGEGNERMTAPWHDCTKTSKIPSGKRAAVPNPICFATTTCSLPFYATDNILWEAAFLGFISNFFW